VPEMRELIQLISWHVVLGDLLDHLPIWLGNRIFIEERGRSFSLSISV
jgi:hypothetical protein